MRTARLFGAFTVVVGLVVLIGWAAGNVMIVRGKEDWTPIVPLTAVTFCLAGASLLAIVSAMACGQRGDEVQAERRRRVAMDLGLLVALIGARRYVYYQFDWSTSLDMLGFTQPSGPGQMAALTATTFLLAGIALSLTSRRRFDPFAQWIAAVVILIGWLCITRYLLGGALSGGFSLIAMHTALLFAVLGLGIFYARPDGGFMLLWNGNTAGSVLVRRLFPTALLMPVGVGLLRLMGQRAGYYGLETGLTIFAISNAVIFVIITWHTASKLHREDLGRREAERTLRNERRFSDALVDGLPGVFYMYDQELRFQRWNRNFELVSGRTAEEITRMQAVDFIAKEDQPRMAERVAEVFAGGKADMEAGFLAKAGTVTPYYFTGHLVQMAGTPCLAGVGFNISKRRQAEEQVREMNVDLECRVAQRTAELVAKNHGT